MCAAPALSHIVSTRPAWGRDRIANGLNNWAGGGLLMERTTNGINNGRDLLMERLTNGISNGRELLMELLIGNKQRERITNRINGRGLLTE